MALVLGIFIGSVIGSIITNAYFLSNKNKSKNSKYVYYDEVNNNYKIVCNVCDFKHRVDNADLYKMFKQESGAGCVACKNNLMPIILMSDLHTEFKTKMMKQESLLLSAQELHGYQTKKKEEKPKEEKSEPELETKSEKQIEQESEKKAKKNRTNRLPG